MNRINTLTLLARGRNCALFCQGLFALAILLFSASMAAAQPKIGVNLGDTSISFGPPVIGTAGVVPQGNWFNYGNATATNVVLSDDLGIPTTAQMSFTGSILPAIQPVAFVAGPNEALQNSYVTGPAGFTMTVTNVPYANYDLIVYITSVLTGRTHSVTVGSNTLFGLTPQPADPGYNDGNPNTPYIFTSAVGTTSGTATPNGNYFRFNGLTGSTLTFSTDTPNDLPSYSGFQIIAAVPEPSSLALAGLGTAGLLVACRKRKAASR